jgi:uncharacterized protein
LKKPSEFRIELPGGKSTTALFYAAVEPRIGAALILGHGAGAGQQSPFMTSFASALSGRGADVMTFNFLYTEQKRRLPDPAPALESCYRAAIMTARDRIDSARRALFIGGKSMGGRIATQVAAADGALPVAGVVLLGYPLHPPGRLDRLRDAHLPRVSRPMLFVQGTRDAFGTPDELAPVLEHVMLPPTLYPIAGGDHSFKVSGRDKAKQAEVYEEIQVVITRWMSAVMSDREGAR